MARRAVVVGAGLGGLSAAVHLRLAGWQVTVVDALDAPGGKVRQLRDAGFTFDMGPTILAMPQALDDLFAAAGRDRRDALELLPLDPFYRAHFPDGTVFEMSSSREAVLEQVRRMSPRDERAWIDWLERSGRIYRDVERHFLDRLFHSWRDLADPRLLLAGMRMDALVSLSTRARRQFRDDRLRQLASYQAIYVGASPDEVPATYALIAHLEATHGVWFPRGGMWAIADAIAGLCADLGVELRFRAPVARIVVEGGRARGVELAGGGRLAADAVVSNADLHRTYGELLPGVPRRDMSDARLARLEPSSSAFILHLGVDRRWPGLPHHTIVFGPDFARDLREIFVERRPLTEPSFYVCAPSETDPALAPAGATSLYLLAPQPALAPGVDWDARAQAEGDRLVERAEQRCLPGLRDAIIVRHAFTPADFARDYGCHAGSIFGLSARFDQTAFRRPAPRSRDVPGLWLVGGSTQPGGGVPMVLIGGRLVARDVLRAFGGGR